MTTTKNPLDQQVGGSHYKRLAIQPVDYIHRNGLGFIEGNVVKYVTRWRDKGGVDDLRKARHFLDILIAAESNGVPAPDTPTAPPPDYAVPDAAPPRRWPQLFNRRTGDA